jgi:acyl-coenzyme A synthetase/AMP-(fatty) acid ligase
MRDNLYSIYNDSQKISFIYKDSCYTKCDVDKKIAQLEENFCSLFKEKSNKRVYLDIKDRFSFLVAFFTMKKLDIATILVPIEIQPQLFFEPGIIYISDNKHYPEGIFLTENFSLVPGEDFCLENIRDFENTYDLYFFTSGSTGKSKNIGKWSSNILTELKELKRLFSLTEKDVFLCIPPIYHIYGFLFTMLPIFSSAVLDLNSFFTPESIADYVAESEIDYLVAVPSYYSLFDKLNLTEKFSKLKGAFSSSGPLPNENSKSFFEKGIKIYEIYGSTETGGMAYRVFAENPNYSLIDYVNIKNYDPEQELELFISSPAISVEYDKDTGYCTGDVVKFVDEKHFTLLGRNTRFVKIHGKRVDLGFVSANFRDYLKESYDLDLGENEIFVGCQDENIYVLLESENELDTNRMSKDLRKILPGYAVPKKILLTKIPRNTMGKINKVAIEALINNAV